MAPYSPKHSKVCQYFSERAKSANKAIKKPTQRHIQLWLFMTESQIPFCAIHEGIMFSFVISHVGCKQSE